MIADQIASVTGGRLLSGDPRFDVDLSRISIDSRTIRRGDFFIAISGPSFSGDDFVGEALRKGAVGAIVTRIYPVNRCPGSILIIVKDSVKALQDMARRHRAGFDIPVICVTGSNGKTTVKDMIASVLSSKYNVLKNEGTRNNHIGVPHALLALDKHHDICVMELGANHKGEIDLLSGISRPSAGVITNIGPSHLEFFKDLEGVYQAKMEMALHIKKGGILVANGDDQYLARARSRRYRTIRYGLGEANDLKASKVSFSEDGLRFSFDDKRFELALMGVHNVYNAMAAIAICSYFGIALGKIRSVLKSFKAPSMRMECKRSRGIKIINDAYNSNPVSMRSALEAIRHYPARRRWVVSGDMLELGERSMDFHNMVGEMVSSSGVEGLLTFGNLSKYTLYGARRCGMSDDRLWHCSNHKDIIDVLKAVLKKGDVVLVKGSRAMRMERVVDALISGGSKDGTG